MPASVIAEIDRTHEIPPTLTWPAPRTGIVVERTAIDGMRAAAGESLFRLADISVVWAVADVPEGDLPQIAVGESATVRPRGSDHAYAGKISLIYPTINAATRTARVRIELPNPEGALLTRHVRRRRDRDGRAVSRSSPSPTGRSSTAANARW